MWDRIFLNRLRRDAPDWVERGWLTPDNQRRILEHVAAHTDGVRRAPLAFAVLGVVMFGAGVVTFFAANWQEINKLSKLILLFGALWAAYGGAAWLLAKQNKVERRFGHALLLLGIMLFGANIMLIAQIYHIPSHDWTGVLLWALGALLLVYLVPSQLAAVAGIALMGLWSGLETSQLMDDERLTVHWPFVIVWLLFLPPLYRHPWKYAAWLLVLAVLLWTAANIIHLGVTTDAEALFIFQALFLASLCMFLTGEILRRWEKLAHVANATRSLTILVGLSSLYALCLRWVHEIDHRSSAVDPPDMSWIIGTTVGGVLATVLAVVLLLLGGKARRSISALFGAGLLVAIVVLSLIDVWAPGVLGLPIIGYVLFNALFFGAIIWLVYSGYRISDGYRVNMSFLFFAAWLLTLYFDTFWGLLDRSFFFMGGGVVLFAGGYLLDRQRRRLVRGMDRAAPGGQTP